MDMSKITFGQYNVDNDGCDSNSEWMFAYSYNGPHSIIEYLKYNGDIKIWI